MTNQELFVFTDGGSRGNPGPAAIGFVIRNSAGKTLARRGEYLGETTNNVAEYQAVIKALAWIGGRPDFSAAKITFFLDSKLVVNQLNGLFKIKNARLRQLIIKVRQLERKVGGRIVYRFVPREKNREADSLVNQSLDEKIIAMKRAF